jgi:hypothetical protein
LSKVLEGYLLNSEDESLVGSIAVIVLPFVSTLKKTQLLIAKCPEYLLESTESQLDAIPAPIMALYLRNEVYCKHGIELFCAHVNDHVSIRISVQCYNSPVFFKLI